MQEFDFDQFFNELLSNDYAFYGLAGIGALLVLLIAWRLFAYGRNKHVIDLDEPGSGISDPISEQDSHGEPAERIDEPVIRSRQAADTEPTERRRIQPGTDTVEVLRHLSSNAEGEQTFDVKPVGESTPKLIEPEREIQPPAAELPVAIVEPEPEPVPEPVLEPEPEPEPEEEAPKAKTLEEGLAKTRGGFMSKLNRMVFGKKKIDDAIFEDLEEILYSADIGSTATRLFESITEQCKRKELKDPERIREMMRAEILTMLKKADAPFDLYAGETPKVILMVGVNGVGKTTTIGKLAKKYSNDGKQVILAAGDTFRAAAVEQLGVWGERAGVEVIKAKEGANPSGVLYSAVEAAKARMADVLIADTAGRLHTKFNLMEELRKMKSVTSKALEREPDEIWLVIDANTGQNAINQAAKFHESLGLTGLILTKLDGTAKGGVVIGITDQLGLPIRYIGIGEGVDDLRPFNAEAFVEALF